MCSKKINQSCLIEPTTSMLYEKKRVRIITRITATCREVQDLWKSYPSTCGWYPLDGMKCTWFQKPTFQLLLPEISRFTCFVFFYTFVFTAVQSISETFCMPHWSWLRARKRWCLAHSPFHTFHEYVEDCSPGRVVLFCSDNASGLCQDQVTLLWLHLWGPLERKSRIHGSIDL